MGRRWPGRAWWAAAESAAGCAASVLLVTAMSTSPHLPPPLPPSPNSLPLSHSVEFVEERREALDHYLQALLAHEQLRREWRGMGGRLAG